MKTIIFVRHAEAILLSKNPSGFDFDREISENGKKDINIIANKVKNILIKPDVIISSTAMRSLQTAEIFARILSFSENEIIKEMQIYEVGYSFIKNFIANLDNNINSLMIFGHNPDMLSLSVYYSGMLIDDFPTCGVLCIDFENNDWEKITETNGQVRFFEYPKKNYND